MTPDDATPCPGRPEAIAAMVDGGLSDQEHQELTLHAADCPVCYELLVELMHTSEAEAPSELPKETAVAQFPAEGDPPRISKRPWMGLAASLMALFSLLYLWPGATVSSSDLVAGLEVPKSEAFEFTKGWLDTNRGDSEEAQERGSAFRLGVLWVDLQLAWSNNWPQEVQDRLGNILNETRHHSILTRSTPKDELESLKDSIDTGTPLNRLRGPANDIERALDRILKDHNPTHAAYFLWGKLVESSRLAILAEDPQFFERRSYRRALQRSLKDPDSPVNPDLAQRLLEQPPSSQAERQEVLDLLLDEIDLQVGSS